MLSNFDGQRLVIDGGVEMDGALKVRLRVSPELRPRPFCRDGQRTAEGPRRGPIKFVSACGITTFGAVARIHPSEKGPGRICLPPTSLDFSGLLTRRAESDPAASTFTVPHLRCPVCRWTGPSRGVISFPPIGGCARGAASRRTEVARERRSRRRGSPRSAAKRGSVR